ncbi:hypothetical protein OBK05_07245 [Empedobacter falsenii]
MKKIILLSLLILPILIKAQINSNNESYKSKIEQLESKNGVLVKKNKFPLTRIKTFTLVLTPTIEKYIINNESLYFYNLRKISADDINIEYNDLLEVQRNIKLLKIELNKDISNNLINIENKYITNDFFEVGYNVDEKLKSYWFISNKYILNSFEKFDKIETFELFENSINEAVNKIQELKNQNK